MNELSPTPTKIIIDIETKQRTICFEYQDPSIVEKIFKERSSICKSCSHLEYRQDKPACKYCGCSLERKWSIIYPFDEEGKAFNVVLPDGKMNYVCRLKKW